MTLKLNKFSSIVWQAIAPFFAPVQAIDHVLDVDDMILSLPDRADPDTDAEMERIFRQDLPADEWETDAFILATPEGVHKAKDRERRPISKKI